MRISAGKLTNSIQVAIHATNWGYPVKHEWEIGITLFKWYVTLEFFD